MREFALFLVFVLLLAGITMGGPLCQAMFHFLIVMSVVQFLTKDFAKPLQ